MRLIANALNNAYLDELATGDADNAELIGITLAVAWVTDLGPFMDLAERRQVPLTLYALADENGFPSLDVLTRFVSNSPTSWRLFLTRAFYHPKIIWLRGVGCYIGSANLTQSGRLRNIECGVWFTEEELAEQGFDTELEGMLNAIHDRCIEAREEDIKRFRQLRRKKLDLAPQLDSLRSLGNRLLGHIPGSEPPDDETRDRSQRGGKARKAFVTEWNSCLQLLRKLGALTAESRELWPEWVERDVSPAVAFDQATEHWYTMHVRRGEGTSAVAIESLHARNRGRPEEAVRRMFADWKDFDVDVDGGEHWDWREWCNVHPRELRALLSRESLRSLDQEKLRGILYRTHSAREHGRQVSNHALGLPAGTQMGLDERTDTFAAYLLRQSTSAGRTVGDTLQYVLWGDSQQREAAERVWDATRDPAWRIPHLGANILGEMMGYARPDEFPPRNHRMVKTLHALGYEGLRI